MPEADREDFGRRAHRHYDYIYGQVVSYGEVLSTKIVSAFLQDFRIANKWLDTRQLVRTDNTCRDGKVNWPITEDRIKTTLNTAHSGNRKVCVICHTEEWLTNTLGREVFSKGCCFNPSGLKDTQASFRGVKLPR
jgi:aspartate kinase